MCTNVPYEKNMPTVDSIYESVTSLLGSHFFLDVDLSHVHRVKAAWDDPGAQGAAHHDDDLHSSLEGFTHMATAFPSDQAEATKQPEPQTLKTVMMDSVLKALLLLGALSLQEYVRIARDLPRRVLSGVYLEQRFRAFERLYRLFLHVQRQQANDARTMVCDDANVPLIIASWLNVPYDVAAASFQQQTPSADSATIGKAETGSLFTQLYFGSFALCVEATCAHTDQWQTTLEAWRPVAERVFGIPSIDSSCVGDPATATATRLRAGDKQNDFTQLRIWQPFFFDGHCKNHLHALGFQNVIHAAADDFFARVTDPNFLATVDLIWDNPPYTSLPMKRRVLRALVQTKKPFCILVQMSVVQGQLVRDVLDMREVQLAIPRTVSAIAAGNTKPTACKGLVWLCYKIGLLQDVYFI
eukprot:GEMP01041655.1.p1 GENE.GEMP01041655.1~~GEMP01041655.1.p1  ORF type:complete len:413 (+),score=84.54 GEMP01041655.1:50-1288(+)